MLFSFVSFLFSNPTSFFLKDIFSDLCYFKCYLVALFNHSRIAWGSPTPTPNRSNFHDSMVWYLAPTSDRSREIGKLSILESQKKYLSCLGCFVSQVFESLKFLFQPQNLTPELKGRYMYLCLYKHAKNMEYITLSGRSRYNLHMNRSRQKSPRSKTDGEDKKSLRVKRTVKSAQLSFEDRRLVGGKGPKASEKTHHIV